MVRRGTDGSWWSGWAGRGGSSLVAVGAVTPSDAACEPGATRWVWRREQIVRETLG